MCILFQNSIISIKIFKKGDQIGFRSTGLEERKEWVRMLINFR